MDESPHPSVLEHIFGIVAVFSYSLHNAKYRFPMAVAQLYVCPCPPFCAVSTNDSSLAFVAPGLW
jgi:hypothetical protein